MNTLHVVADDKKLNLRYGWQHTLPSGECYIDVMGPRFNGLPPGLQGWIRVQAPVWDGHYYGSPRFVRQLVLWALEPKAEVFYKVLPPGHSTYFSMASPWAGGLPTFSSSPGQVQVHRSPDAVAATDVGAWRLIN